MCRTTRFSSAAVTGSKVYGWPHLLHVGRLVVPHLQVNVKRRVEFGMTTLISQAAYNVNLFHSGSTLRHKAQILNFLPRRISRHLAQHPAGVRAVNHRLPLGVHDGNGTTGKVDPLNSVPVLLVRLCVKCRTAMACTNRFSCTHAWPHSKLLPAAGYRWYLGREAACRPRSIPSHRLGVTPCAPSATAFSSRPPRGGARSTLYNGGLTASPCEDDFSCWKL